tara:strand:- start:4950 stop:5996 length:1047 start_codon:yes stop_codon:yes gene_type:complete
MPSITPFDLIKIQKLAGDSQKAIDDFMDLQDIMMKFDMNYLQKLQNDAFDKAFDNDISYSDKILLATNIKTLTDILDKIIEKLDSEGIKKAERLCRDGITNVLTEPIFVRVITPFFESKMPNLFEKLKLLLSFVLEHDILERYKLDKYKRFEGGGENGAPDEAQIFKLRSGLKQINNAFKELGKALVQKRRSIAFTSDKSALQNLIKKQQEEFQEKILDSQVKQIIAKLDELFKKAGESSGDQDKEMLTLEICRIDGSNFPQCTALVKNLELRLQELDYKNKIPELEAVLKTKNAKEKEPTKGGKRRKKRKTNKRKSRKRKKKTIRKRRNKTKKSNKKPTRKRRKRHK